MIKIFKIQPKKNYYFLAEEQEYDSEISRYLKLMSEDLEKIASFKIDNLTKKDLEKCYNVFKNQFVIKVYNHNDFFFPRFSRKSKIKSSKLRNLNEI